MTAIFGVLGPICREELDAMAARLAHKGIHSHFWSPAADVWLGEVRHTPRTGDEDELTAFSGQLYLDWRKHSAANDNDAAQNRDYRQRLIAASAVREDPIEFGNTLDGYFGIASWDPARETLILAVDRLRYERIYFTRASSRFVFASEYKALLALEDIEAAPNPDAIQYSVSTVFPNNGRTLLQGIETVVPGHALVVSKQRQDLHRYFRPRCAPAEGGIEDFANGLRQTLVEDVRGLLSHHDRIAITLSGGLDSAGLLGIIRHALPSATLAAYTIAADPQDPAKPARIRVGQNLEVRAIPPI